jgi:isopentenyl-diphosphate delta-isomerase
MNRKDDHIRLALAQNHPVNDFDLIRFKHVSFPEVSFDEINLGVDIFGTSFPLPFFINAMTGGSEQAGAINQRLAQLANHFSIPMATGSVTSALKDPTLLPTFTIIKKTYPKLFLIANIGAGNDVIMAKRVIDALQPNALQIHVNAPQEALMPEGDRDFRGWLKKIQDIRQSITIPLIVKEVGFGMSFETMNTLKSIGIQYIDVAGKGGTNFAVIENNRQTEPLSIFNEWGLTTVESLLEAQKVKDIYVIASGGIRHGLDVVKALALGAQYVGLSGYFLKLVSEYDHDQAVKKVEHLIQEIKTAMVILGAKTTQELITKSFFIGDLLGLQGK